LTPVTVLPLEVPELVPEELDVELPEPLEDVKASLSASDPELAPPDAVPPELVPEELDPEPGPVSVPESSKAVRAAPTPPHAPACTRPETPSAIHAPFRQVASE
jgi:hypothetical protein